MGKKGTTFPSVTWIVPKRRWPSFYSLLGISPWHPERALASVWIRGYQIAPYLRKLGYSVCCNSLNPPPQVAIFLRCYGEEDIVLAKKLKAAGTKIVIDVVVNYFSTSGGLGQATPKMVDNFKKLIDIANQVWTVSPYLKEIASHYHPHVTFISDSVDVQHFHPRKRKCPSSAPPFILGWSGVSVKADALNWLAPILTPLIKNGLIHVLIISDKQPSLDFPYEFRKWSYEKFPEYINDCDLCIAPRKVDNDYDRGHSIFKIGVFMAMGVPVLAGPVPSYELLLGDGIAGAICSSLDEWDIYLHKYISDNDLRISWANNSINKIIPYLTSNVALEINNLIRELIK